MIRLRPGLRWAVIGAVPLLAACASTPTPTVDPAAEVAGLLEGRYSSQSQSHMDPAYFDVRLGMRRIWRERTDEHWLYVEQAMATALDRPYRQRVYRIEATPEVVPSATSTPCPATRCASPGRTWTRPASQDWGPRTWKSGAAARST